MGGGKTFGIWAVAMYRFVMSRSDATIAALSDYLSSSCFQTVTDGAFYCLVPREMSLS